MAIHKSKTSNGLTFFRINYLTLRIDSTKSKIKQTSRQQTKLLFCSYIATTYLLNKQ